MINPLEPKRWDADGTGTVLAQHISFLRDWLRSYKPLTDAQSDTVEILLEQLYRERGITKETDISALRHEDFPLLSDLYALLERQEGRSGVFTDETLRELRLHLLRFAWGRTACISTAAPTLAQAGSSHSV